jgi:putative endopeptidase
MKTPPLALPMLMVVAGLAACDRPAAAPQSTGANPPPNAAQALLLDETRLSPLMRFDVAQLGDPAQACSDFDGYANGKWLRANEIPGDEMAWGSWDILAKRSESVQRQLAEQAAADPGATGTRKIVADFWASGMDQARRDALGFKPVQPELDAIDALTDTASIADYLRRTSATGGAVPFKFEPLGDFKDSSTNIAYIEQGGLTLREKTFYFDVDKQFMRDAYVTYLTRLFELSGTPAPQAAAQATQAMAFETRLAKASKSTEELSRDVGLMYNLVSPAEADKLTPDFPWTAYFKAQGIPAPAKFSLSVPAFHQELNAMLTDTPVAAWKSYLRGQTLAKAAPALSQGFIDAFYAMFKSALGMQEAPPRWRQTLNGINAYVEQPMGELYVQVAFPPQSKAQMETLVANLRTALKTRIENVVWMSPETKQKAMAKWETFTPKIGYPDTWRDWSGLETSRDDYYGNILAARAFNRRWQLGKIGKRVDPDDWDMSPQTVNAYYNPLHNEIVFPAAILQPPFFDPKADAALNYGGIGAVIGHEMTHGYDDQGSRFGPSGNFENWWTPTDDKAFTALKADLVKQYDQYEAAPGQKVNGNLTLGENIADLGGLATAYDAMQLATKGKRDPMIDGLGRDQRFFLSWATAWRNKYTPQFQKASLRADTHAPSSVRSYAPSSNLPAFAAAFSCKPGDRMARSDAERVSIW